MDFGKCVIYLALLLSFLIGCSDVKIVPIPKPPLNTKGTGHFCVSPPEKSERVTKFMFIMDKSGSNQSTDPGTVKRADNIEAFYNMNRTNPYYRWGMISFADGSARALINQGGVDFPIFTGNEALVRRSLSDLRGPDGGDTPYGAALQVARQAIIRDLERNPKDDATFMVFFVSDGEPTDVTDSQIINRYVKDLLNASPDKVYLSTAFYGPNGLDAEDILRKMAKAGRGKYVNFNNTNKLDFKDLIVGPSAEPWQLKKLLVYNINAGFCEDGLVDVDSDGDGLCDKDEQKYTGFDPSNRFSFEDGYGDYFHWRVLKFGEALPKCNDRSDTDLDLLTNCEEAYIRNRNAPEQIPQSGDILDPDTDHDGYIDGIETFVYFTRTLSLAMDPLNVKESLHDNEKDDAGTQISQHRNPLIIDPDAISYDTYLAPAGINPKGQTCYEFSQSILPLYPTLEVSDSHTLPQLVHGAKVNVVLVYYLQVPQSEPNGPGSYRYSYQLISHTGEGDVSNSAVDLKVVDSVFTNYTVPRRN